MRSREAWVCILTSVNPQLATLLPSPAVPYFEYHQGPLNVRLLVPREFQFDNLFPFSKPRECCQSMISTPVGCSMPNFKDRGLTQEALEELSALLSNIDQKANVLGSCIFSHDGSVITNTMPEEFDPEWIGLHSLAIYLKTLDIAGKLGHKRVQQINLRTEEFLLLIADLDSAILITIST